MPNPLPDCPRCESAQIEVFRAEYRVSPFLTATAAKLSPSNSRPSRQVASSPVISATGQL